jgi:ATP-dependent Clp endopeptidase proteolytic subunit ClpP
MIDGDIGDSWWNDESITARKVVKQLKALPTNTKQINIRINSFGGAVSDGLAIYNALRESPVRKVTIVDGVAISCGSLIAMAADEIQMPATSLMMIHAPWSGAYGNAKELRKAAEVLDKWAAAMVDAYVRKTGKPREEIESLLTDGEDHWYTGAEAVEAGFADTLIEDRAEDSAAARFLASAPERLRTHAISAFLARKVTASMPDTETPTEPAAEPVVETAPVDSAPAVDPATEADPVDTQARVDAAVAAAVEAATAKARAELAAVQAKLDAEIEAKEVEAAVASARAAYAYIPGKPEDLGGALRTVAKVNPAAFAVLDTALKAANALLALPGAGTEPLGSGKTEDPPPLKATIDKLVAEVREKNPTMTPEMALVHVYTQNPKIVAALRGETE